MCQTCGCGESDDSKLTNLQTGTEVSLGGAGTESHHHHHDHGDHDHHHHHDHAHATTIELTERIVAKNDRVAEHNRGWLAGRGAIAINVLSSPGAGKTLLLERTIRELSSELPIHVIEGDQATLQDAERIRATGRPVVQINTGAGCHLDADMVRQGLAQLNPASGDMVLIENVGNLVCPALFDLGEDAKVVLASVTEGQDKPIKYPHMFRAASLVLLNKIDLLEYVDFDVEQFETYLRQVNPGVTILHLSARTGEGTAAWYAWLKETVARRMSPVTG